MKEYRTYGRDAVVELEVYNVCKYHATPEELENPIRVKYTIESWEIVSGGVEAEAIEAETDADGTDDYHEYLILNLTDGSQATFRNSYCDMFRVSWK